MSQKTTLEKLHIQRSQRWNSFLNELKVKENIDSDSALADTLNVTRAFISAIRKNKRDMPEKLAEQIFQRLSRKLSMFEAVAFLPDVFLKRTDVAFATHQASADALKNSVGKCELCDEPAPFELPLGIPYLESFLYMHESKSGITTIFEIALCPNCNQKMLKAKSEKDHKKIEGRYSSILKT